MTDDKITNLSAALGDKPKEAGAQPETAEAEPKTTPPPSWREFIKTADDESITERLVADAKKILDKPELANYNFLALIDSDSHITDYDLDRIYAALMEFEDQKDTLLFLFSPGGSIEPAYQISKICKQFAKQRFVVAVPRQAKSAATLIAIGADEIHMGPLGHLGPIDPQLGSLPALGVSQALKSIATLSEQHPGSADMFAKYLSANLTVEQIGYCERISESAAQYAERLLMTKPGISQTMAKKMANELVHEYKDHGFVIDIEEAHEHLGNTWIKIGTKEAFVAEHLYLLYNQVNTLLRIFKKKRIWIIGGIKPSDVVVAPMMRR